RLRPVAGAAGDLKVRVVGNGELERVVAHARRPRLEAEDVAVGNVVGDGQQVALELLLVAEREVLAAGQARGGLRDILLHTAAEDGEGSTCQCDGRRQLGQAVEV